mgnify:CR=1 FL=1
MPDPLQLGNASSNHYSNLLLYLLESDTASSLKSRSYTDQWCDAMADLYDLLPVVFEYGIETVVLYQEIVA